MEIKEILGGVLIVGATVFSVIGVVGLHRFPDVYSRLHVVGKVSVFGLTLLILCASLITGMPWTKAGFMILLLVLVGPVVSHVLGAAAYDDQIPMNKR